MSKEKIKYYSLKAILEKHARYNVIFGERSNGKTYAVLEYGIRQYVENRKQMAIVRRYDLDFQGKRGATMFDNLVSQGKIVEMTGGEWSGVTYYSGRWYLSRRDDDLGKNVLDETPLAYAFSLAAMEHDKSTSYPGITIVMFDEFISSGVYLQDEFITFMHVLSTIIRDRDDVTIFMLGNTRRGAKHDSLYFREMGIKNVKKMKQGDIDVYHYGESKLVVAVEFADSPNKGKPSDVYFAFDNPRLQMITTGSWELDIYPHKPVDFLPKDVRFIFFIVYDGETLQCEIVKKAKSCFLFIHRKTGEIRDPDRALIYSPDYDPRPNWRRNIKKPMTPAEKKIVYFFAAEKVYYQDNEIGELMNSYLLWCSAGSSRV